MLGKHTWCYDPYILSLALVHTYQCVKLCMPLLVFIHIAWDVLDAILESVAYIYKYIIIYIRCLCPGAHLIVGVHGGAVSRRTALTWKNSHIG